MKKLLALVLAAAMVLALVPMSAMAASVTVTDEVGLQKYATEGGEVELGAAQIQLSKPLEVWKNLTIHLNGNEIVNSGTWSGGDSLIVIRDGGSLTINGTGNIETDRMVAIKLGDAAENNKSGLSYTLNINGGTITGGDYGISGNGLRNGSKITITGGTVQGSYTGIFHPQNGQLSIGGTAKISGGTAVEMRAGKVTISGNAELWASAAFSETPNASGPTTQGVALALSQHTTEQPVEANITGGTMMGEKAFYEADEQGAPTDVTISISGGIFDGAVSSQNKDGYITGGLFADVMPNEVASDALVIGEPTSNTLAVGDTAREALQKAPEGAEIVVYRAKDGEKLTVAPGAIITNGTDNNIEVNGKVLDDDEPYPVPAISAAPIPETGDGMGVFVFAALALISLLGMAVMKKREQF